MSPSMNRQPAQEEAPQRVPPEVPINIEDPAEAQAFINERLAAGEWPVMTMPVDFYEDNMANGIPPLTKFDKLTKRGYSVTAATIGRQPFTPPDEQRVICRINPKGLRIVPRATGADKAFHGVVAIMDPIPTENIVAMGVSSPIEEVSKKFEIKEPPLH